MQLPDIIKTTGLGDKIKEGMEKGQKAGEERRKTWDRTKKGRMVFNGGMGEVDAQACWRYTRNKQLREALENELNKQGLGGSGQNALEKMKQIETNTE
jgi:hypothetical protein